MMARERILYVNPMLKWEIIICTLLTVMNLIVGLQHQYQPEQQKLQQHESALQTLKQWKLLTYNFLPNAPLKDSNFYNPLNVLITGLAVSHDRIFIATPKLFSGVSSTLNYVSMSGYGDSPDLQAYPDWSYSTTGRTDFNCSDMVLVSVYRLRIDSCNRLWALDAGITASLEDFQKTCPPKILVIDLNTDQVVRRIDFPAEILRGETLFTNLVIDETTSKSGTCDDIFVYISDTVEPGIIVYDSGKDITWRVTHPAMYPDPDFAESKILEHNFILMDGIVGMAFDANLGLVYFQPLATDRIFSIHKNILRAGPVGITDVLDVKLVGKKSSQGIGLTVSAIDGSLIFSPMSETAVASWNPHTSEQSVLAYDRDQLQFIADMTTSPHDPGAIYVISSKFHRFFLKNLDTHEFNNRILRIELARGGQKSHPLAYPGKPIKFGHYYTNALNKQYPTIAPITKTAHFSRPLPPSSQTVHPYEYEPVGLINYASHNSFKVLNEGEDIATVPRAKSFLDSLAETSPQLPRGYSAWQPILNQGYYYRRGYRSVKEEKVQTES